MNASFRTACAVLLMSGWLSMGYAQTLPEPTGQESLSRVEVSAKADADERPYQRFVKAMELFDAERPALAPQSNLRFHLDAKRRSARVDALKLTLTGTTVRAPVALTPEHFFTVERNELALREDATVRSNRKEDSFNWSVDVRTPGLAANTRRLGDLRLQCRVELLAANLGRRIFSPLYYAQTAAGADPCTFRNLTILAMGDEPIFTVTLVDGARRQVLPVSSLYGGSLPAWVKALAGDWPGRDRVYELPLWDASWPHDTLVELEPMRAAPAAVTEAEPPPAAEALQSVTRADLARWLIEGQTSATVLQGVFGSPEVVQFANGDASWVFRSETGSGKLLSLIPIVGTLLKPERTLKELHVLVGADGTVRQYRLEEMVLRL
ncbi:hypothetical protein SAMN05192549_106107 [Duganella sacchari]|uniref:Uncharacterized protein n=1 Tax=Duganella sacchari TaxID=551987 RepID=A0A1M7Q2J2_9BURK|nr:hypothetical protein SAMN05192549_106107 [Duganella sacchari]